MQNHDQRRGSFVCDREVFFYWDTNRQFFPCVIFWFMKQTNVVSLLLHLSFFTVSSCQGLWTWMFLRFGNFVALSSVCQWTKHEKQCNLLWGLLSRMTLALFIHSMKREGGNHRKIWTTCRDTARERTRDERSAFHSLFKEKETKGKKSSFSSISCSFLVSL